MAARVCRFCRYELPEDSVEAGAGRAASLEHALRNLFYGIVAFLLIQLVLMLANM